MMTPEQKALKRLAEAYVELEIPLTESEFYALKNSKYKNLLKEESYKSSFDKIMESWSSDDGDEDEGYVNKRNYPLGHSHRYNVNTYRELVKDLIDEIEEHFGIGIENEDLDKSDKIHLHELKQFIKYYIIKNEDKHSTTFERIRDAVNSARSVDGLLLHLNSFLI
jgi:hypothetical protein